MLEGPLVLLVDDFEDALEIYGTWLEREGYRVVLARNGSEAIELAHERHPALILLDLRMPVLDGTSALHAIRLDPRFKEIPILALTAHALEEETRAALLAGFDLVISKPCLPDELAAIVRRYLAV